MYKIKLKYKLQFFIRLFKYAIMNNFNMIFFSQSLRNLNSKTRRGFKENFSGLFQMWDTKSNTLSIDKSAAGQIDRPQRRSGKCNRGRSSGISLRKVYGWNFRQRMKEGGQPGADGKNRLSGELANEGCELGRG